LDVDVQQARRVEHVHCERAVKRRAYAGYAVTGLPNLEFHDQYLDWLSVLCSRVELSWPSTAIALYSSESG
jgi:hypothetical protein